VVRKLQTGFIYSYATAMIIGVLGLMTIWFSGLIAH
jgi:NADH-quinone oxidoreductase subunit L